MRRHYTKFSYTVVYVSQCQRITCASFSLHVFRSTSCTSCRSRRDTAHCAEQLRSFVPAGRRVRRAFPAPAESKPRNSRVLRRSRQILAELLVEHELIGTRLVLGILQLEPDFAFLADGTEYESVANPIPPPRSNVSFRAVRPRHQSPSLRSPPNATCRPFSRETPAMCAPAQPSA